jgi:hypothetical protein
MSGLAGIGKSMNEQTAFISSVHHSFSQGMKQTTEAPGSSILQSHSSSAIMVNALHRPSVTRCSREMEPLQWGADDGDNGHRIAHTSYCKRTTHMFQQQSHQEEDHPSHHPHDKDINMFSTWILCEW